MTAKSLGNTFQGITKMRKIVAALAIVATGLSTVAAGPAATDPPEGYQFAADLKKGDTASFEGEEATGGTSLWGTVGAEDPNLCANGDYTDYCDRGLLTLNASGDVNITLTPGYPADYDLTIYTWDGEAAGEEVASSGNPPGDAEVVDFKGKKGDQYVVVVYYYMAGGGYAMDLSLA